MDTDEATALANESPVAWFFELEKAIRTERYECATEARDQLTRLGVDVRFTGDRWGRFAVTET